MTQKLEIFNTSFTLMDMASGFPSIREDDLDLGLAQCFLWFAFMAFMAGCARLMFNFANAHVVYAFMLLLGWAVGFTTLMIDMPREWLNTVVSDSLMFNLYPIMFFYITHKVDYHALTNTVWLILLVATSIFICHNVIIVALIYTWVGETLRWSVLVTLLLSNCIGMIQVNHCITELSKVQGQTRVLQLMLLGERFFSYIAGSMIEHGIVDHANPNDPPKFQAVIIAYIFGWTIISMFIGVLCAQVYRFVIQYFYKDIISQTTLSVATIYLMFWGMEVFKANGGLSIICYGITLGFSKIKYSSAAERFFGYFWDLVYFLAASLIFAQAGIYLGSTPHKNEAQLLMLIFIVYILVFLARGLGFLIAYPFIKKMSYQISIKHLIIATLGVNRSSMGMAFILSHRFYIHGYSHVLFYSIVALLSTFFNVILFKNYLRFFALAKMTRSRLVNMNVAMAQVNECREKSVLTLRTDRLVADSNWKIVDKITYLPHPYAGSYETTDENIQDMMLTRVMDCKSCEEENEIPPTPAELENMKLEAKLRVLKAQLVSFWKQHENGTLSQQSVTILNNLVEVATVKKDPTLSYRDLNLKWEGSRMLTLLKRVFGKLFTKKSVVHQFIPTNAVRAVCFRLCTSRSYQMTMACIAIVDFAILFFMLQIHYLTPFSKKTNDLSFNLQVCDVLFFMISVIDFVISVLGIGFVEYFCTHINKIEFSVGVLIRGNQLAMYLYLCLDAFAVINVFVASQVIFVQKLSLLLRATRIHVFFLSLISKIMVLIDQKLHQDLMRSYDIGKAYLISLKRVTTFLNHIADYDSISPALLRYIERERHLVTRELGLIQKDRPAIANSNKTRHAIRHTILCMGNCISKMKDGGLIDPTEYRSLLISLENVKARMLHYNLVFPSEPEQILYELPWVCNDQITTEFLLKHARLTTYAEGEKIIYYGENITGLYILVSGMVRCRYIPSEESFNAVSTFGKLPNCDYFTNLKFENTMDELVMGGNLIGEIGIATRRKYEMEVSCETRVQLYFIPWKALNVIVFNSYSSDFVQAKIWKSIGMKIALHLLKKFSRFQGWQDYEILLYLQKGFVPMLEGVESLHINDLIEDVILIEGRLMEYASRTVFVAPVCIPHASSQRLVLPKTPLWDVKSICVPRLLIIPHSDTEMEDIMSPRGLFKFNQVSPEGSTEGLEGCKHQSTSVSKLMKNQKNLSETTHFMDYMPTIKGAIKGMPATFQYIERADKSKDVQAGPHPRSRNISSIFYTQDIEEQSEIEPLKDNDDEGVSSKRKGSSKQYLRSRRKKDSQRDSSASYVNEISRISQNINRGNDTSTVQLVQVIDLESKNEEPDAQNDKKTQTVLTKKEPEGE